jgi:hypothetical protein
MTSHLRIDYTESPYTEPYLKDPQYRADVRALKARLQPVLDRIEERRAREDAEREAQEAKR